MVVTRPTFPPLIYSTYLDFRQLTGLGEAAHTGDREQNRDATRKIHYSSHCFSLMTGPRRPHYFPLRLGSLVSRGGYYAQAVASIRDKNVPMDISGPGGKTLSLAN